MRLQRGLRRSRIGPGRGDEQGLPDRLALRIDAGLRQLPHPLIVHDDVALLDRGVVDVFQCLRPALAGTPATAGLVERGAIAKRIRHRRVGLLGRDRHRFVDAFARIAMRIKLNLGGGAGRAASLLVLGKASGAGGGRDRVIEAVAGAHADGAEGAARHR